MRKLCNKYQLLRAIAWKLRDFGNERLRATDPPENKGTMPYARLYYVGHVVPKLRSAGSGASSGSVNLPVGFLARNNA